MQTEEPECKRARKMEKEGEALDPKQQQILELCITGRNVFLTGVGGTGKTFLLLQITKAMYAKYGKNRVAVTASTGVAAVEVEGQTLHSITGAGVPNVVSDFEKCQKLKKEWRSLGCLIIDEISLLEPSYLDWLDSTVRAIRGTPFRAFGGIQLIWSGDFLQLPAICKGVNLTSKCPLLSEDDYSLSNIPVHVDQFQAYAFQTVCWQDAKFAIAELTTIFRQSEIGMIQALRKIRRGVVDDEVRAFVLSCRRALSQESEIKPTILYSRNRDVDNENRVKLNALASDVAEFKARDEVFPDDGTPDWTRSKLLKDAFFLNNGKVPERVVLKVGAQVLLTKNLDKVLVNGSRGVVKRFTSTRDETVEAIADRLTLCTDATIRYGLEQQLERVKTAELVVSYPVVLFQNGEERVCAHEEFKHRVWNAGDCKRFQVPLKLAWSMTIHRCQGTSLDRVQVDLSGCFSPGQCYVALSRARTSVGLQVIGFTESVVKANPLAVGFHDALAEGTLDAFMQKVPLWFEPVLQQGGGVDPNWRKLFESSKVFKKWMRRAHT